MADEPLLKYENDNPNGLLEIERLDQLRAPQERCLAQLKSELDADLAQAPPFEEVRGDVRLLRFLRATKYDVMESAQMFRTMMAWRKSADIDAIRNDIVNRNLCQRTLPGYQEFTEAFPVRFFFGQDKEGNPVCRDMLGQFNPKECSLSEDNLQRFWIYHLEFRMLLLDRLSREHNRMMLVYEIKDLEGVGLGQLWSCKPVLQKLAKINTTYYVETTRRVAVINLPGIFQALYTAAKPFIPERSKAKIKIIDESDQNEIVISEDMCLDSFHATEPVFDARPTPPVVIPAGTFKTPPGTPPHVKCNRTDLDVNEFRKAMVDLGIVYAEDLESRYQ